MSRKQKPPLKDVRIELRDPSELPTIVQVKGTADDTWKEVTKVTTVSKNGAGFSLSRPCQVGQLVTLVLPMPTELRAYDHDERLYPVMGLVQYCNKGMTDGETVYHVGVGFIGKQIPKSYNDNPLQSYRITGMDADGLWQVTEAETPFQKRQHPRFWVALDVTITLLRKAKKAIHKETAVTQNIGASGVSIICSLAANVGDKVKFACKAVDFYAIAIVRNRREKEGQLPTLHLEFVENVFPVEKILTVYTKVVPTPLEVVSSDRPTEAPPPHNPESGQFEFHAVEI